MGRVFRFSEDETFERWLNDGSLIDLRCLLPPSFHGQNLHTDKDER